METTPLLDTDHEPELEEDHILDKHGLRLLLVQHASNAGGDRTAEFAFYLFLVEIFRETLLPSALYGFCTTVAALTMSRWMGSLVDRTPKLHLVRSCILVQKVSATTAYAAFLLLFLSSSLPLTPPHLGELRTTALYAIIVVTGCALRVSTICIQIAVEKDWVIAIAGKRDENLSMLNVSLRRVDLFCNLLSPLIISLFTTLFSYQRTMGILAVATLLALGFELYWIQVVYSQFSGLKREDEALAYRLEYEESSQEPPISWKMAVASQVRDWADFVKLPVFLSSLAVSMLYITVLSFDGNMLGYLKWLQFGDPFLATMRGLCVLTGLLGTVVAPALEEKLGSVRAGNWSIWSEVLCLAPVVLAFYLQTPTSSFHQSMLTSLLLFGGMAASRVGLWSFDLIQLKQLQQTLASHPRRNVLVSMQYSLANVADMLKYVLAISLSRPTQFPWAALASFVSVFTGATIYTLYLRKERGHVFHVPRYCWKSPTSS